MGPYTSHKWGAGAHTCRGYPSYPSIRPFISGAIAILKENKRPLSSKLNPDPEKVVCRRRGSLLAGKRFDWASWWKPHWAKLHLRTARSAHVPTFGQALVRRLAVYLREMNGDSCARLRFLPTFRRWCSGPLRLLCWEVGTNYLLKMDTITHEFPTVSDSCGRLPPPRHVSTPKRKIDTLLNPL